MMRCNSVCHGYLAQQAGCSAIDFFKQCLVFVTVSLCRDRPAANIAGYVHTRKRSARRALVLYPRPIRRGFTTILLNLITISSLGALYEP